MSCEFDLIVIGGGPGGYGAAIRASQLGLNTALVEKAELGGVCLNWGCIPSKNLIHQAETFQALNEMEAVGVRVDRTGLDYSAVQAKSRSVVKTLTGGVKGLMKKNNITVIPGEARISKPGEVIVGECLRHTAKHMLIATGSRPMQIPGFECDENRVLSSTGILAMTELPAELVILGGGAIGCEFAYVMNAFGVKVTLVEAMDHLLPSEDFEVCQVLKRCFEKSGIEVLNSTRALDMRADENGVRIKLKTASEEFERQSQKVLVVFGRQPNTENLGLEALGVEVDSKGYVVTGPYNQTNVPGIYAIGDVTETPALAHVATAEGELAVEHMAGVACHAEINADHVPSAIYCEPQVAGFGLREDAIAGRRVKKSVFNYPGAGKSIAVGKPDGLVKILCDAETNEILGAHIVGHNATELIHELLLASQAELLPEDITNTIHAHPTLSEAILEAARGINGQPIHA